MLMLQSLESQKTAAKTTENLVVSDLPMVPRLFDIQHSLPLIRILFDW